MRQSLGLFSTLRSAVAAAALLTAGACMGPTGPDDMEIGPLCPAPDPTFAGIRVQPTAFNLRVGLTVQLQVTPVDAQGS